MLAKDKFCGECGRKLQDRKPAPAPRLVDRSHPASYTPNHLAEKILTQRSAIQGERKLVTVFFADVAGFTSISEKLDPEDVHEIMDGCFDILMGEIHRFEGTINQFTGDGVMALFGAPVAHEDHAPRACRAALAIQEVLEPYGEKVRRRYGVPFQMRIGINSGPVVVGAIGDDLRMDYTAVGDTTNLAARMESHARPGHALISENTCAQVRDYFELAEMGPLHIKGKGEPQKAWELVQTGSARTRLEAAMARGLSRFVGRSQERETLNKSFQEACAGRGQMVGVVGEAGVGKSRLLMEFRRTLDETDCLYLEGRCIQYGGSMAYLPILAMLRRYFDIQDGEGESAVKEKLENRILSLDENLKHLITPFQEILSLKVDDADYLQIDPKQRKMMAFDAVRDLFVRESQERPLVLAVEDLHWIDKTSAELLGYLVEFLENANVLLILLYRPEYTHAWGNKSFYHQISVNQLSSDTAMELVHALLEEGEVDPELRDLLLNRTGGNPLFVEELTHSLLENGAIQKQGREYVLSMEPGQLEVPDTIQGIIAARIDRVEENLKRIMQVASVIGREFAFRLLQNILEMREDLRSSLFNLQGLEFISQKQLFPELEYIFKHALTQEVAYNSLLVKRRRHIHERIGETIEKLYPASLEEYCELLVYHYTRSDNSDKALYYLNMAIHKAFGLSAMEEAMSYYEQAMALLDTLPETDENLERRITLLVNQWAAYEMLLKFGEYYELLKRYEPAAVRMKNQGLLGVLYARMGHCEWWFGHNRQSIQSLERGLELCEAAGNVEGIAYACMQLQWNYWTVGQYDRVIELKPRVMGIMDQFFNLRLYAWSVTPVVLSYAFMGQWKKGIHEGNAAVVAGEKYEDKSIISFAEWNLGVLYNHQCDFVRALKHAERAVQVAPTPADKVFAQPVLAWALVFSGKAQEAIEMLTELLAAYESIGLKLETILCFLYRNEGYLESGQYENAEESARECCRMAESGDFRMHHPWALIQLGEVYLNTNPDQIADPLASPYFDKAIGICREIKAENHLARAYAGYGRFHKQRGETEKAREYLEKALEIFERLGTLVWPDTLRKELFELG